MDTILNQVIAHVKDGGHCSVNFKTRTLTLDGCLVELSENLGIEKYADLDAWLDKAEDLYDAFKYSRPTMESEKQTRNSYFKALSFDEIARETGNDPSTNPIKREVAKAELETFILLSLVNGSLNPDELFARDWFYQGTDKSFVLLSTWF